jgi:hypothetical protein
MVYHVTAAAPNATPSTANTTSVVRCGCWFVGARAAATAAGVAATCRSAGCQASAGSQCRAHRTADKPDSSDKLATRGSPRIKSSTKSNVLGDRSSGGIVAVGLNGFEQPDERSRRSITISTRTRSTCIQSTIERTRSDAWSVKAAQTQKQSIVGMAE